MRLALQMISLMMMKTKKWSMKKVGDGGEQYSEEYGREEQRRRQNRCEVRKMMVAEQQHLRETDGPGIVAMSMRSMKEMKSFQCLFDVHSVLEREKKEGKETWKEKEKKKKKREKVSKKETEKKTRNRRNDKISVK